MHVIGAQPFLTVGKARVSFHQVLTVTAGLDGIQTVIGQLGGWCFGANNRVGCRAVVVADHRNLNAGHVTAALCVKVGDVRLGVRFPTVVL
ncbi:hypothetical protein AB7W42_22515 [Providencia rettgeri]